MIENLLSARLAEQEGFPLVCVSGQAPSRMLGIPDVGLVTLSDLLAVGAPIAGGTDLPALLDIEDGKGTAMHVHRGIKLVERAGFSAVLMEDADLVPHLAPRTATWCRRPRWWTRSKRRWTRAGMPTSW